LTFPRIRCWSHFDAAVKSRAIFDRNARGFQVSFNVTRIRKHNSLSPAKIAIHPPVYENLASLDIRVDAAALTDSQARLVQSDASLQIAVND